MKVREICHLIPVIYNKKMTKFVKRNFWDFSNIQASENPDETYDRQTPVGTTWSLPVRAAFWGPQRQLAFGIDVISTFFISVAFWTAVSEGDTTQVRILEILLQTILIKILEWKKFRWSFSVSWQLLPNNHTEVFIRKPQSIAYAYCYPALTA